MAPRNRLPGSSPFASPEVDDPRSQESYVGDGNPVYSDEEDSEGEPDVSDLAVSQLLGANKEVERGKRKRSPLFHPREDSPIEVPARPPNVPILHPPVRPVSLDYPAEPAFRPVAYKINDSYFNINHLLSTQTGFFKAKDLVEKGLEEVLTSVKNQKLVDRFEEGGVKINPLAVVVVVWVRVCLRLWCEELPEGYHLATKACATLTITAQMIIRQRYNGYDLKQPVLEAWEERLLESGCFEAEWYTDIKHMRLNHRARNTAEEEYYELVKGGDFDRLSAAILEKEFAIPGSPIHDSHESYESLHECLAILLGGVESSLLLGCIDGNLPRRLRIPLHKARKEVSENEQWGDQFTAQYGNWIADAVGMPPTSEITLISMKAMIRYLKDQPSQADNLWAAGFDDLGPENSWDLNWSLQGYRRYSDRGSCETGNVKKSEQPRQTIRDFAATQVRSCQAEIASGRGHHPMLACLGEIGFSRTPGRRQLVHKNRQPSSNYLLNVTDASFEACFGSGFELTQAVVALVWEHLQSWLGEIAFTHLCQTSSSDGYGFNHHQPGLSNRAPYDYYTGAEWDEMLPSILTPERLARIERVGQRLKERREARERKGIEAVVKRSLMENNRAQIAMMEAEFRARGIPFDEPDSDATF